MEHQGESLKPEELLAELGWVRALARNLLIDPEVSDDVLQQVCLLALQKAPQGARTGPQLRAWLAAVTRSLARRSVRSAVRRRRWESAAARPEAQPATADLVAHREALKSLVEAVTALPEPYFSAIIGRYFEGLSVADIAARSDATPAAVRQHLSRGRSQLRSRLERLVADDRDGWLASALALPAAGALLQAGQAASNLGRLGGRLVARRAGQGAGVKIAFSVLTSVGIVFLAWLAFVAPEDVATTAIVAPEAAAGGDAPREFAVAPPAAPEPIPISTEAQPEPAASPWSFGSPAAPEPPADNSPRTFRLVIVDREAKPVAGALVETCVVTGETLPDRPLESEQVFSAVATTFTDSSGRCTVTLAPSEHTVMVSKDGVGSSGRRNVAMLERDRNADDDTVIALLPFLTISGQVHGADGSPAGGLAVSIRPTGADGNYGPPRGVPPIFTDGAGRFECVLDHSNQYLIETTANDLRAGSVVNPKRGETITVELQLPGNWLIGGSVHDEAGTVVAGAQVMVLHLPDDGPAEDALFSPLPKDCAVVDAAGAWSMRVRDAGTYLVAAFAKGFPMSDPQRVQIAGTRDRHELALTLEAPSSITGSVVDASGAAVPGVSVFLEPVEATMLGDVGMFGPHLLPRMLAKSRRDGSFSFKPLPEHGVFELWACDASSPGAIPCSAPRVRAIAGTAGLRLIAEAGAQQTRGALHVHLHFRDPPTASPLPRVSWQVSPEGEASFALLAVMKEHRDADQTLVIDGLDPGRKYTLAALAEGYGAVDLHDLVPTPQGTDVSVELPLPGALEIEVIDARGAPVAYSQVQVERSFEFFRQFLSGPRVPRATDSAGSTRFEQLDPGRYRVTATSPAGPIERDVVVGDGEDVRIQLKAGQE